jgi:hypothetical protein
MTTMKRNHPESPLTITGEEGDRSYLLRVLLHDEPGYGGTIRLPFDKAADIVPTLDGTRIEELQDRVDRLEALADLAGQLLLSANATVEHALRGDTGLDEWRDRYSEYCRKRGRYLIGEEA